MAMDWIDPFGAQEFFVDAVQREIVCPGLIRMIFGSIEDGRAVAKVKVLCSVEMLERERAITDAYLAAYGRALLPN